MNVKSINNTNFKAIPIAKIKIKGIDKQYKLLEITQNDNAFLNNFYKNLDLKTLMPNLKEYEYVAWDGVIQNAVEVATRNGRKTILETFDDKPCGLLNYKEYPLKFHLNYVATVPVEPKQKVPCAGQILFNEFFRRLLDSCVDKAELNALKYSAFSPISKYLKLGFKFIGGDERVESMRISREHIVSELEQQDKFIQYSSVADSKEVFFDNTQKTGNFLSRLLLPLIK